MIATAKDCDKRNSHQEEISELVTDLQAFVQRSASSGIRQYDVERGLLQRVLRIGRAGMDWYLDSQGDGDLGASVTTTEGQTLKRSPEPVCRPLRTVFGEHAITSYTYSAGAKQAIALRPIDARLELPEGKFSYFFQELSQFFCVEQAFGSATERLQAVLGQKTAVDSLERISQRLGEQAEEFLDNLPTPPAAEEGEILVATADGKGVPLVRAAAEQIPVFETRERPGNRRMATLGCVYSVDAYVRTAEEIVAALFRDSLPNEPPPARPEPRFKQYAARFARTYDDGGKLIAVPGPVETFSWIAQQVQARYRPEQTLILLMDGQDSQWEAADKCLEGVPRERIVEILDVIHVSSYVWRAAKVFHADHTARRAFVRQRLQGILEGEAKGVVMGLRRMATSRGLRGVNRREIHAVCRYLENNLHRMRYDEYLKRGYPIATGVIEGACRHVIKDRLERSGMRWTLDGAQSMLNVRCVLQSSYWEEFNEWRMANQQKSLHPHASIVKSAGLHRIAA